MASSSAPPDKDLLTRRLRRRSSEVGEAPGERSTAFGQDIGRTKPSRPTDASAATATFAAATVTDSPSLEEIASGIAADITSLAESALNIAHSIASVPKNLTVDLMRHDLISSDLSAHFFEVCDIDGNGAVDLPEFIAGVQLMYAKINSHSPIYIPPPPVDEIKVMFHRFDVDKDDVLSCQEVSRAVPRMVAGPRSSILSSVGRTVAAQGAICGAITVAHHLLDAAAEGHAPGSGLAQQIDHAGVLAGVQQLISMKLTALTVPDFAPDAVMEVASPGKPPLSP